MMLEHPDHLVGPRRHLGDEDRRAGIDDRAVEIDRPGHDQVRVGDPVPPESQVNGANQVETRRGGIRLQRVHELADDELTTRLAPGGQVQASVEKLDTFRGLTEFEVGLLGQWQAGAENR